MNTVPVIHRQTRNGNIRTTLPMILQINWEVSFDNWEMAFWILFSEAKLTVLSYLNKVQVVHSIQMITRQDQNILNILASCILRHEKRWCKLWYLHILDHLARMICSVMKRRIKRRDWSMEGSLMTTLSFENIRLVMHLFLNCQLGRKIFDFLNMRKWNSL